MAAARCTDYEWRRKSPVVLERNGIEGIYVPIHHNRATTSLEDAARILQKLFGRLPLSFLQRQIRPGNSPLTLGLDLKPYPHSKTCRCSIINDPKADLGDKGQYRAIQRLKGLSKTVLVSNKLN